MYWLAINTALTLTNNIILRKSQKNGKFAVFLTPFLATTNKMGKAPILEGAAKGS